MTYAPIDDRFDAHPKYVEADWDMEHYGMQACGITYCNRNLTDGRMPEAVVRRFGRANAKRNLAIAAKLVEDGVWERVEGGFRIVGFLEHNPSKASIERKRSEAKARKDAWIKKKLGVRSGTPAERVPNAFQTRSGTPPEHVGNATNTNTNTDPDTESDPDATQTQSQTQTQTQTQTKFVVVGETSSPPAPRPESSTKKAPPGVVPGTRMREDWEPSPDLVARLREKFRVDPLPAVSRFRNHWINVRGKNGIRPRWDLTFENWVGKDADEGKLPVWVAPPPPQTELPVAAPISDEQRAKLRRDWLAMEKTLVNPETGS